MKEKLYRFMQGRYGTDSLNKALFMGAMITLVLSWFGGRIFYWISLVLIIIAYCRMFSRNIPKRIKENQWYYTKTNKVRNFMIRKKKYFKERKIYHIYKCPVCKQKIRVPRGKGKIEIRCAKCQNRFIKNS